MRGLTMGTYYHIVHAPLPACAMPVQRVEARLAAVNQAMSTYLEDSEISRFNRYALDGAVPVSPDFSAVVRIAHEVYRQSDGALDITVGPLVELWGFGAAQVSAPPDPAAQARAAARVGMQHLELVEGALRKLRPDLALDVSAVAKGFAVDALGALYHATGCNDFMIDIGGEILVSGRNPRGGLWHIGIASPGSDDPASGQRLALSDVAVATSGDYLNFVMVDSEPVDHILDPRTGRPAASPVVSATVVHASAAYADAYATALMVLDVPAGLALADRLGFGAYLIFKGTERGTGLAVRYNEHMRPYLAAGVDR